MIFVNSSGDVINFCYSLSSVETNKKYKYFLDTTNWNYEFMRSQAELLIIKQHILVGTYTNVKYFKLWRF